MANIRLPDVEHFVLEWAGFEVADRADVKHLHLGAPGVENVAFDVVHSKCSRRAFDVRTQAGRDCEMPRSAADGSRTGETRTGGVGQ